MLNSILSLHIPVHPTIALFTGKTVVITGGNSGIGKATAVDLAKRQAKVILACRTAVTAQECVSEIKQLSGNDQVR